MKTVRQLLAAKGGAVYSIAPKARVYEALRLMAEKEVGALVVLDGAGRVAGVFSERDLVREIARHGANALSAEVGAAMSREVITAAVDETIDECLSRMTDRRVRHLPVIAEEVRLLGIVSIGDLVKHRIAKAEAESAAMQAYIAAH
jgi:CBS domain-containing protein